MIHKRSSIKVLINENKRPLKMLGLAIHFQHRAVPLKNTLRNLQKLLLSPHKMA